MKLLRLKIVSAASCAGLLDGLEISFRQDDTGAECFEPLCLIGPNGAGKSQLLQVLAEIFQSLFATVVPEEERNEANTDLCFELEYSIRPPRARNRRHVKVSRKKRDRGHPALLLEVRTKFGWEVVELSSAEARALLPSRVVGYTSGGNETLSLPFLISRSGYADEVTKAALRHVGPRSPHDTRLLFIDYGTHLEVLVANLLFGTPRQRAALLRNARLAGLRSLRCIVRLGHSAAPKVRSTSSDGESRSGIHLTTELADYVADLQHCATCWSYNDKTRSYIFDFFVDAACHEAFACFWSSSLDLYTAFHKLSMLNDLALPKPTRDRVKRETKTRRFASRLPEPPDEDKVFGFVQVKLVASDGTGVVDYVAMSDGEHQSAQLLGVLAMASEPNVLFLLDEPESHFNPQWRVSFLSDVLNLPTSNGNRRRGPARAQECLLTTHAPFVPSDLPYQRVLIFSKTPAGTIEVRRPEIETYGATFDEILDECFEVRPPISQRPREELADLMETDDVNRIQKAMVHLGTSTDKMLLASRLRSMTGK